MFVLDRNGPVAVLALYGCIRRCITGCEIVGIRDRRFGEAVLVLVRCLRFVGVQRTGRIDRQTREAPCELAVRIGRDGDAVADLDRIIRTVLDLAHQADLDALRTDVVLIVRIIPDLQAVYARERGRVDEFDVVEVLVSFDVQRSVAVVLDRDRDNIGLH